MKIIKLKEKINIYKYNDFVKLNKINNFKNLFKSGKIPPPN